MVIIDEDDSNSRTPAGILGLHLIKKAQKEIKEMNQLTIFQKSKIKKRYMGKAFDDSIKIRNSFELSYNKFLNNKLSSTFLKIKEDLMDFKIKLIDTIKKDLSNSIRDKIKGNPEVYIKFLINALKTFYENSSTHVKDTLPHITLLFNTRDYEYFQNNFNKIEEIFKNPVEIQKNDDFFGGFKVLFSEDGISYDYSIDQIIQNNSILIEREFNSAISDSEIKIKEHNFGEIIEKQRDSIEVYLEEYDQI